MKVLGDATDLPDLCFFGRMAIDEISSYGDG